MKLTIPKMMLKQIDKFILSNDYADFIKQGFKVTFDFSSCELIVTHKQKQYVVTLVNNDNNLYWHLVPYNKSFFETFIDNGLKIVLFAIKENEELYEKKGM